MDPQDSEDHNHAHFYAPELFWPDTTLGFKEDYLHSEHLVDTFSLGFSAFAWNDFLTEPVTLDTLDFLAVFPVESTTSSTPISVMQPISAMPPISAMQPISAMPPISVMQPISVTQPISVMQPISAMPPIQTIPPLPESVGHVGVQSPTYEPQQQSSEPPDIEVLPCCYQPGKYPFFPK